jgi:serine phosphatase RsbU (regulator of sigma subunit)
VEIHAQLIEGIFDGDLMRRPVWLPWVEALALGCIALCAILGAGRGRPRNGALAWAGSSVVFVLAAALTIRFGGLLVDIAWPLIGGAATYAAMLLATLVESDRQRRALRRALDDERIASARNAGEQEAARRVQMGMLPPADGSAVRDPRVAIAALAEPARSVGGDLYDYFLLDEDRLFLVVGDVSGKGLPAALFMSVAKALLKSAALRGISNLEEMLDEAHAELARDNTGQLFITLFAGILHLDSGMLDWCNAGHEPPLVIPAGAGRVRTLDGPAGAPLCVIEGYPYDVTVSWLAPGERLCIVTDGITEAHGAANELLGRMRFAELMGDCAPGAAAARDAIVTLLESHGGAGERADDVTALIVEWRGGPGVNVP